MGSKIISGVRLADHPGEQDSVDLIGAACEQAVPLIQESWGLETPEG
jgi:hypothetical protein